MFIFCTTLRGLILKLGNGGASKGPAVCPAVHSLAKYLVTILGCCKDDLRLGG